MNKSVYATLKTTVSKPMIESANHEEAVEPRAVAVRYRPAIHKVELELSNGVTLLIPRELLEGAQCATTMQMQACKIVDGGTAVRWEELDFNLLVAGLASRVVNARAHTGAGRQVRASAAGRRTGRGTHADSAPKAPDVPIKDALKRAGKRNGKRASAWLPPGSNA